MDMLKKIEEEHKKQDVCKHEYEELKDAYSEEGIGIYFCSKCKGLKHEVERRTTKPEGEEAI